jgi:Spy/CpxP family protein refolding chaperone
MNQSWKVILAFTGVFIAGAIFGAALSPSWLKFDRAPRERPPFRERIMQRIDNQVNLTEEQKVKLRPIAKRMEEETHRMRREGAITYRTVMDGLTAEMALELTPEQRVKLEEMRQRFRERMERREKEGFRLPD